MNAPYKSSFASIDEIVGSLTKIAEESYKNDASLKAIVDDLSRIAFTHSRPPAGQEEYELGRGYIAFGARKAARELEEKFASDKKIMSIVNNIREWADVVSGNANANVNATYNNAPVLNVATPSNSMSAEWRAGYAVGYEEGVKAEKAEKAAKASNRNTQNASPRKRLKFGGARKTVRRRNRG